MTRMLVTLLLLFAACGERTPGYALIGDAERGQVGTELHSLCENVRPLYAVDDAPPAQLQKVSAQCRTLWNQREMIARQLLVVIRARLATLFVAATTLAAGGILAIVVLHMLAN